MAAGEVPGHLSGLRSAGGTEEVPCQRVRLFAEEPIALLCRFSCQPVRNFGAATHPNTGPVAARLDTRSVHTPGGHLEQSVDFAAASPPVAEVPVHHAAQRLGKCAAE